MGELRFPTLNVKPPRKFREMVHKYKRLVEGDEVRGGGACVR